jgi:prophage regulatory protein
MDMDHNYTASPSLRPRQAAAFLGIGESTLWRWVRQRAGFPKPISLGVRTTVFRLVDLAAWRDGMALQER